MSPRFYLLHGLDDFAMTGFVDALVAEMGDPATASLNLTRFDGRSVTLPDVQAACGAMPFLCDFRLVIVEGWLTKLLSRSEEIESDGDAEPSRGGVSARETFAALAAYLEEQPDTARLVLLERRELPEKNIVVKAALGKSWALVRKFDLPKGEELVKWIRARAKTEGGEFTREAAQALAEAEHDPRALGHEIAKLLAYVNFNRPVDGADVNALTPAGSESRIFDFVDFVGQRKGMAAQRELHKLLDREEPLYVLGMIVRQFRYILLAKELLESRRTEADIAHMLNLKPYPTGIFCAQSRNYTLAGLERIYRRLLDCDTEIKTGKTDSAAALDVLVAELTT